MLNSCFAYSVVFFVGFANPYVKNNHNIATNYNSPFNPPISLYRVRARIAVYCNNAPWSNSLRFKFRGYNQLPTFLFIRSYVYDDIICLTQQLRKVKIRKKYFCRMKMNTTGRYQCNTENDRLENAVSVPISQSWLYHAG